jgi:hypothetical protein
MLAISQLTIEKYMYAISEGEIPAEPYMRAFANSWILARSENAKSILFASGIRLVNEYIKKYGKRL